MPIALASAPHYPLPCASIFFSSAFSRFVIEVSRSTSVALLAGFWAAGRSPGGDQFWARRLECGWDGGWLPGFSPCSLLWPCPPLCPAHRSGPARRSALPTALALLAALTLLAALALHTALAMLAALALHPALAPDHRSRP